MWDSQCLCGFRASHYQKKPVGHVGQVGGTDAPGSIYNLTKCLEVLFRNHLTKPAVSKKMSL